MPRLDFYVDYKLFAKIKLHEKGILLGRAGDCDVQLPDERVSRHHARIKSGEHGSHEIENLSPNGTRLNAAMLETSEKGTRLEAGDRIYIGDYVVIFQPDEVESESLQERQPTKLAKLPSG